MLHVVIKLFLSISRWFYITAQIKAECRNLLHVYDAENKYTRTKLTKDAQLQSYYKPQRSGQIYIFVCSIERLF